MTVFLIRILKSSWKKFLKIIQIAAKSANNVSSNAPSNVSELKISLDIVLVLMLESAQIALPNWQKILVDTFGSYIVIF